MKPFELPTWIEERGLVLQTADQIPAGWILRLDGKILLQGLKEKPEPLLIEHLAFVLGQPLKDFTRPAYPINVKTMVERVFDYFKLCRAPCDVQRACALLVGYTAEVYR